MNCIFLVRFIHSELHLIEINSTRNCLQSINIVAIYIFRLFSSPMAFRRGKNACVWLLISLAKTWYLNAADWPRLLYATSHELASRNKNREKPPEKYRVQRVKEIEITKTRKFNPIQNETIVNDRSLLSFVSLVMQTFSVVVSFCFVWFRLIVTSNSVIGQRIWFVSLCKIREKKNIALIHSHTWSGWARAPHTRVHVLICIQMNAERLNWNKILISISFSLSISIAVSYLMFIVQLKCAEIGIAVLKLH